MEDMKNTENQDGGNVLTGFVLMTDANMDWLRVRKNLKDDWGIETKDEDLKDGAMVFNADEMMVACSVMPCPVPDGEAEKYAKNNILWKDGDKEVAKHNAHCMIAIMTKTNPIKQAMLFAKVAASVLKLNNTIGIYKYPTVYEKQFYINFAESIKQGEFPMPILIYVGMYLDKDGVCGFTSGLKEFGKDEIEVINSKAQPNDLFSFLLSISEYIVTSDAVLKDGETIGFTEEQKLAITRSAGVSLPFDTIKIVY